MTETGDLLLQKKAMPYRPAVPVYYTIQCTVPATGTQKQTKAELKVLSGHLNWG
jgi:hypothetical protein